MTDTTDEGSLQDRRDLPVFIHSELDDLPLSPNAFRLYCHLARRAGPGIAWPSYQTMGDKCFSTESDNAGTRRTWTIKAMKELVAFGLVKKELRQDEVKGNKSNVYYLTPRSEWKAPGIGGIPGGVSGEYPPSIGGILKGTPSESTNDDDDVTPGKVFALFENVMPGSLTPFIADSLNDFINTYGCKEVYSATEKAGKANARNLSYIETILVNRAAGKDKPQKKGNDYGNASRGTRKVSSANAAYVIPGT
jgi:hypothetical protein